MGTAPANDSYSACQRGLKKVLVRWLPHGSQRSAERVPDRLDVRIQRLRLRVAQDPCVAGRELDPVVLTARREPLDVGVRNEVRMRIEGDQADLADLGNFEVSEYVPGHIIVGKSAVAKAKRLAGDFAPAIPLQQDVDGSNGRERHAARNHARYAVVQKAFLDPSA